MSSNTYKTLISNGIHFITFLVGVTIGFLIYLYVENLWQLKISPNVSFQIDPLSIISIIISIYLAVYVLRILNKRDEKSRKESDLLISYFCEFEKDFTTIIRQTYNINGVILTDIAIIMKNYSMRIQELLRLAIDKNFIDEKSTIHSEISDKIKLLKELLTNTPVSGAVEDGIKLSEGKLYFSDKQKEKIVSGVYSLRSSIFNIVSEIN